MATVLSSPANQTESNWERFSEWIHCICVITFDLELGQALEVVYPEHIHFSEQEKLNICYLAFPDSNSGCMGDTQFHVRLRVAPATKNTHLSPELHKFNKQCVPTQQANVGHFWGFVYFRQIKDPTLPRGYFQKSVVLLTRLPFINMFYEISALISPKYFANGESTLQTACTEISNWPSLSPGECYQLPLLGTVFQTYIPSLTSANMQQRSYSNIPPIHEPKDVENNDNSETANSSNFEIGSSCSDILANDSEIQKNVDDESEELTRRTYSQMSLTKSTLVLSSVNEIDIFRSLCSVLPYTHMLWELVLTAEPIVVMASSPNDCSHMVQTLSSLIAPLSYCAESRPYFTIHDSEFKEFTQRQQGPPPVILGVTNPFFSKTLQHWPHTIRLSDNISSSSSIDQVANQNVLNSTSITSANSNQPKFRKLKIFSKILDSPPGVYTQYKPFLQKDKNLIKNLLAGVKKQRPTEVQSALLRRHLLELTQSFMIPLERYMASLMPLQKDISPFKSAPVPNHFKQDSFLATLEQSGPQLTSPLKGDWAGLYKKFFRSPNFRDWYDTRYKELSRTLQHLQAQALANIDIRKWLEGKQEVEIVDMILKVKQKIQICNEDYLPQSIVTQNQNTRTQLLQHLEVMKKFLPDDLKELISL